MHPVITFHLYVFKQIYDGKLVGKYLPHLPDPELPPQCRTQQPVLVQELVLEPVLVQGLVQELVLEPVLVQELVPVLVLAEMIVSVRCIIAGL